MKALVLALFLSSCASAPAMAQEYYAFDRSLDPSAGALIKTPGVKPKTDSRVPQTNDGYVYNIVMIGDDIEVIGTVGTLEACSNYVKIANTNSMFVFMCAPDLKEE